MSTTETQDIVGRLRSRSDNMRSAAPKLGNTFAELNALHAADAFLEAAAEIERLRSLTEWRPIETAPRDGTPYVICREGDSDSLEVGLYDPLMCYKYVEAENGLYQKVPEQISDYRGFNNHHRATHWLPLPHPPGEK